MYTTKKSFGFNPDKNLERLSVQFLPDEDVRALFALSGNGTGVGVLSTSRFVFFKFGDDKVHVSVPMDQVEGYESTTKLGNNTYNLKLKDGSLVKVGLFLRDDEGPVLEVLDACIRDAVSSDDIALDTPDSREAEFTAIESNIPWKKVPKHLQKNLMANISADEKPLFIISTYVSASAGSLVAMKDRCLLIKSGALAGFMAGSLGGARVTSFYYRDITGIEYNSGMVNGVVEILTASYNGSANKDFWKGATKPRNADSNDPWTLSNTLPFGKSEYSAAKAQFDKLRSLISAAKGSGTTTVVKEHSVADEIEKLSNLLAQGLIDQDEFKEAKKKILGI
jgi:hypothetical protein